MTGCRDLAEHVLVEVALGFRGVPALVVYNARNNKFKIVHGSVPVQTLQNMIQEVAVPEPTPLAVLGLGGILLARRRRCE